MTVKITLGLGRKVRARDGAREASIHLEWDATADLLADPARLRNRCQQVFAMLRAALEEELTGQGEGSPDNPKPDTALVQQSGQHADAASVRHGAGGSQNVTRPAPPAQVQAIRAGPAEGPGPGGRVARPLRGAAARGSRHPPGERAHRRAQGVGQADQQLIE